MIRNLVIYLVISGTLVSSLAVTGQVYASFGKVPDTGIGPDIGSREEATEDQATDEGDNETTSERVVPSKDRFCMQGTGGATGKPCIPCDPGLGSGVACIDILTGGPLDMPETATSESGESKVKGGFSKPEMAEMLLATDNTAEKTKIIFENLENQGKVPPNTTEAVDTLLTGNVEESTKALGTLCETASKDKSSSIATIDCNVLEDQPTGGTTTVENKVLVEVLKIVVTYVAEKVLDSALAPIGTGAKEWCKNNPGKC